MWTGASQAPVLRKVLAAARAASEEQRDNPLYTLVAFLSADLNTDSPVDASGV